MYLMIPRTFTYSNNYLNISKINFKNKGKKHVFRAKNTEKSLSKYHNSVRISRKKIIDFLHNNVTDNNVTDIIK